MKLLKNKKILVISTFIITALIALGVLEKLQIINLYSKKSDTPSISEDAKTTSTTPTAQSNFNSGNVREPGGTISENKGSGGITDNNGNINSQVNKSSPVVSSTGEITIFSPQKQAQIYSGYPVAGKSSLAKVSYRLIDDISGVIAMGELNVINGNFSGKLSFDTQASTGRLDIYGEHDDGREFSNIEISLRFK